METGSGFATDYPQVSSAEATALGDQIMAHAAGQACLAHEFCALIGRFDAAGAAARFDGIKSTAHWVAFYCAMSAGAAREHVRVARTLPKMPRTSELFQQGRLSYSKVREITRLVDAVDDEQFCELALEMTASQLARTVRAYRNCAGTRIQAMYKRGISTHIVGDSMVRLIVTLPAEDAAVISAAIETAARQTAAHEAAERGQRALNDPNSSSSPRRLPQLDRVQALVDIAASHLDASPRTADDDHTLVVVHVNAASLTEAPESAEAKSVPAGTSVAEDLESNICHVEGHGPIESSTAQRLICTAAVQAAVIDRGGNVLALGKTRRLASRAQRRALRVRDHGNCQFPGCHQTLHLDAHHIVPWHAGGATDLENLILLCRRHHTLVHEGGIEIAPRDNGKPAPPGLRHRFILPSGQAITGTWRESQFTLEGTERLLAAHAAQLSRDPKRIGPVHGGEGFQLHECVRVLFAIAPTTSAAAA